MPRAVPKSGSAIKQETHKPWHKCNNAVDRTAPSGYHWCCCRWSYFGFSDLPTQIR